MSQKRNKASATISITLITPLVLTPPFVSLVLIPPFGSLVVTSSLLISGSNKGFSHIPGGATLHFDQKLLVKYRSNSSEPDIGAILVVVPLKRLLIQHPNTLWSVIREALHEKEQALPETKLCAQFWTRVLILPWEVFRAQKSPLKRTLHASTWILATPSQPVVLASVLTVIPDVFSMHRREKRIRLVSAFVQNRDVTVEL